MKKFFKFIIIFLVISGWVFSGWPQILNFPPKIKKTQAAVAYDAASESHTGTTGSASQASFTWTHTPTGTPRGALVFVFTNANADYITSVTYGGTAMTRVTGGQAIDTLTELGRTDTFFLGASVPIGAQSVVVNRTNNTTVMYAVAYTITAAADTTTTGIVLLNENQVLAVQAVDDGSPGTNSVRFAGVNSGATTPPPAGTGSTIGPGIAFGTRSVSTVRETTAGQGARNVGFSYATSDDVAAVHLAIRELAVPTVSTQAASSVADTTATCNGTITATGGANATNAGCEWDINTGAPYANTASTAGDYGAAAFTQALTGLPGGTTIYARAFATNSAGTGYGSEITFLTKPDAPTTVAATKGTYTDKVTITWTKSTGATDYHVWRDAVDLGAAGDVATFNDTGADAPTITPGSAVASDGASTAQVNLSLSGASANNGTTHTYKVVASNATGNSADSATDTGYRSAGALTYQWQRSAADSDLTYSNIVGAIASTYGDTAAPTSTITTGTASATDGSATDRITLSITGASANNGEGRYYQAVLNAAGAAQQISVADRGYRGVGALTYQWYKSSGTGDSGYSILTGATTAPYDDTAAPAPTITAGAAAATDGTSSSYVTLSISGQSANAGASRYYYATVSAAGAVSQDTNHDVGNVGVGALTYQWQRSAADSDATYSDILGATTATYNDTAAPADGSGRYYKVVENATGATQQISTADRGYKLAVSFTFTIDTNSVSFPGTLTPGTPVSASSVLTVNTNSATGYNITLARASTTPTLFSGSYTIGDIPNGNNWTAPADTITAGPSALWAASITKGLGFRVKQTGTVSGAFHSAWWGTDDASVNAKYSGISTSTAPQIFSRNTAGAGVNENVTVEYRIDVASNQKSGAYSSSPIIFTALPN